jgi:hypothetical protein
MGSQALRTYPGLLARPRMVHKLLYCWLGGSPVYRGLRRVYRRGGPATVSTV